MEIAMLFVLLRVSLPEILVCLRPQLFRVGTCRIPPNEDAELAHSCSSPRCQPVALMALALGSSSRGCCARLYRPYVSHKSTLRLLCLHSLSVTCYAYAAHPADAKMQMQILMMQWVISHRKGERITAIDPKPLASHLNAAPGTPAYSHACFRSHGPTLVNTPSARVWSMLLGQ
jgi:hypothetical protein